MATTVPGPVKSHDNNRTPAETAAGRNASLSLWRGVRGRHPRCGRGQGHIRSIAATGARLLQYRACGARRNALAT